MSEAALNPIPETIGDYRVDTEVGRGGMGVIYRAEDEKLRRKVAIKTLLPELRGNPKAESRFLREARAMAALKSDHIVTIYGVHEEDGVPYFAMEYLVGQTLEEHIASRGELNLRQVLKIGSEIAQGLADAHANGVVHRDIKPANIFLEAPKGRVKILDFGLARLGESTQITRQGGRLGTLFYMSLEQAEGKEADHRSDIYSFGVVLYRMCTGKFPFRGENEISFLYALAMAKPEPAVEINPLLPQRLSTLLDRILAKNPDERPQSMAEVASELRAIRMSTPDSSVVIFDGLSSEEDRETPPHSSFPAYAKVMPDSRKQLALTPEMRIEPYVEEDPPAAGRSKFGLWIGALGLTILGIFAALSPGEKPTPVDPNKVPANVGMVQADKSEEKKASDPPKKTEPVVEQRVASLPVNPAPGEEVEIDVGSVNAKPVRMKFCWIPPSKGKTRIGSPKLERDSLWTKLRGGESLREQLAEEAEREIEIDRGFYLGKYEVTQEEYAALAKADPMPSTFNLQHALLKRAGITDTTRFPVESVSFSQAKDFVGALTEKHLTKGWHFDLPTENQWEYACRGGKGNSSPFYFGEVLNGNLANWAPNPESGLQRPTKVGSYEDRSRHPWRLCDMHGNVSEWCANLYDVNKSTHVLRGGSWNDDPMIYCRAAARKSSPDVRSEFYGFRVAFYP